MRPTHARGKQSGRSLVEAKADCVTERDIYGKTNSRRACVLSCSVNQSMEVERRGGGVVVIHMRMGHQQNRLTRQAMQQLMQALDKAES